MDEVKLLAVGDMFLQTKAGGNPFAKVKNTLNKKDILFGNLETVITDSTKPFLEKSVVLRTNQRNIMHLKGAGFNIVNLAHNHILDYGKKGFCDTLSILKINDIRFIGVGESIKEASKPIVFQKNGVKIGFIGFYSGRYNDLRNEVFIMEMDVQTVKDRIKKIREKADIVVVSLHWGQEHVFYPSPKQQQIARDFIDEEADIILGHHPHVFQGIENYKKGIICYSLGNFNFHHFIADNSFYNDLSVILQVIVDKYGVKKWDLIPVKINENYQPVVIYNEKEKVMFLEHMEMISEKVNEKNISWNFWFEEISKEYLLGNMKSWIIRIKKYGVRHFLQCVRWLLSPFVIRCYIGFLTKKLKGRQLKND